MAKLIIVDDDYSLEILVENLVYLGHEAQRFSTVEEALNHVDTIASADMLILDIIMPPSVLSAVSGVSGGRTTGMAVFEKVRKKNPTLPILVHSATSDSDLVNLLKRDKHTTFLSKWATHSMNEIVSHIEKILNLESSETLPQSFIVHGHDETTKLAVKNYLQNVLKFPEPIILHEQPSIGRTIIEKLEYYASLSQLVFVILTPDDRVVDPDSKNDDKRRARQNVILELGFFLGLLGRASGRVFLLHKGPLELPSDLDGLIYIDISNGIEAAGEKIRRELDHAKR